MVRVLNRWTSFLVVGAETEINIVNETAFSYNTNHRYFWVSQCCSDRLDGVKSHVVSKLHPRSPYKNGSRAIVEYSRLNGITNVGLTVDGAVFNDISGGGWSKDTAGTCGPGGGCGPGGRNGNAPGTRAPLGRIPFVIICLILLTAATKYQACY